MDSAHEETVGEDDVDQTEQARNKFKYKKVSNKIDEEEEESSTIREMPGLNKSANKPLNRNPISDKHDAADELNQLYQSMRKRAMATKQSSSPERSPENKGLNAKEK